MVLFLVLAAVWLMQLLARQQAAPVGPTPTQADRPALSDTATALLTPAPEPTAVPTSTPTPTAAPTPTSTFTVTPAPTPTREPTPTFTPAPTPTETATPVIVSVRVAVLNVREGPGTDHPIIARVRLADALTVLEASEDGRWFRIETEEGTVGWVAAEFVVAGRLPTPTPTPE
jgi:cytoskeletal protein RodZ